MPTIQPNISFVEGQGGLGAEATGIDHISGLLAYSNTLPSGFLSTDRIKILFSTDDAKAKGIDDTASDETKATATATITAVGATGDILSIGFLEFDGTTINLATYTKIVTDTTVTILATSIKDKINAGTVTHGYTATNIAGVITIVARPKLGIYPNTKTLSIAITGTITASNTAFTGGVSSILAPIYYNISEFFRMNPSGKLYVGIYATQTTNDFNEVFTMANFSDGEIQQLGIYKVNTQYTSTELTTIQSVVNICKDEKIKLHVVYGCNISSLSDLSTIADLVPQTNFNVSALIAQSGSGKGAELFASSGHSIINIGGVLGAISRSNVAHSIGWVGQFDFSNGIENEIPAIGNGNLVRNLSISLLDSLYAKRYIFLKKYRKKSGTFIVSDSTAGTKASDYNSIHLNRVITKAENLLDLAYLPLLGSPLTLNADGTLDALTVATFKDAGSTPMEQMQRNGEISNFEVVINPNQNVFTQGKITVVLRIQPLGIAEFIVIPIGFVPQI